MKIPAIIAELKAAIANDCQTVTMDGLLIGVEVCTWDCQSLLVWFEERLRRQAGSRHLTLMDRWGVQNWTDMDYAVFGDGTRARHKWIRKWLLRELGLPERPPLKDDEATAEQIHSDYVWTEAANAS